MRYNMSELMYRTEQNQIRQLRPNGNTNTRSREQIHTRMHWQTPQMNRSQFYILFSSAFWNVIYLDKNKNEV